MLARKQSKRPSRRREGQYIGNPRGPRRRLSVEVEEVPDEGEDSVSKNPNEIVEQQDAAAVMDIDRQASDAMVISDDEPEPEPVPEAAEESCEADLVRKLFA